MINTPIIADSETLLLKPILSLFHILSSVYRPNGNRWTDVLERTVACDLTELTPLSRAI